MLKLRDSILKYYLTNFNHLGKFKLHFASRLYLWNNRILKGSKLLSDIREEYMGNGSIESFRKILKEIIPPDLGKFKNFFPERITYAKKFPLFTAIERKMLRILYNYTLYNNDHRNLFYEILTKEQGSALKKQIFNEPKALSILSTYALNFLYVYSRFFIRNENWFDLNELYHIPQKHLDLNNPKELILFCYFYTHCIIGETLFYSRKIPLPNRKQYGQMLKAVEKAISDHYEQINLENKLEFLVCARILDFKTACEKQIHEEITKSLDPSGNYIIDTFDHPNYKDYRAYEHRNVLFIMSQTQFDPPV